MNRTVLRAGAWWLLTVVCLGGAASGLLIALGRPDLDIDAWALPFMTYGLVGSVLARRRPESPFGLFTQRTVDASARRLREGSDTREAADDHERAVIQSLQSVAVGALVR